MRIGVLLGLAALAASVACSSSSGGGGSTTDGGASSGGSSSGGSSSSGSSSGGSSTGDAGPDCTVCDKAQTCCVAMMGGDASTCSNFSSSTCELAPSASDQSAYISTCEAQVQSGQA